MQEYSIHRSQRRCQQTERAFAPGESYYSVVLARGSELVRLDLSRDVWNGPPEGTVGWWLSRMPTKAPGKPTPAPASVLIQTLETLLEDPSKQELAYFLALILVRRRILVEMDSGIEESDESSTPHPFLHLTHNASNRDFDVPICEPASDQLDLLQAALTELLFCEA